MWVTRPSPRRLLGRRTRAICRGTAGTLAPSRSLALTRDAKVAQRVAEVTNAQLPVCAVRDGVRWILVGDRQQALDQRVVERWRFVAEHPESPDHGGEPVGRHV